MYKMSNSGFSSNRTLLTTSLFELNYLVAVDSEPLGILVRRDATGVSLEALFVLVLDTLLTTEVGERVQYTYTPCFAICSKVHSFPLVWILLDRFLDSLDSVLIPFNLTNQERVVNQTTAA
jgi:hypothetical protein